MMPCCCISFERNAQRLTSYVTNGESLLASRAQLFGIVVRIIDDTDVLYGDCRQYVAAFPLLTVLAG